MPIPFVAVEGGDLALDDGDDVAPQFVLRPARGRPRDQQDSDHNGAEPPEGGWYPGLPRTAVCVFNAVSR